MIEIDLPNPTRNSAVHSAMVIIEYADPEGTWRPLRLMEKLPLIPCVFKPVFARTLCSSVRQKGSDMTAKALLKLSRDVAMLPAAGSCF